MAASADMTAFLRIIDRGGFAAASRGYHLTPSALSKLVQRLEARLGVRLLTRTTRRIALTPEGELYAARARDILALIDAAESDVTASSARPRGHLVINSGSAYARHRLIPALPEFTARYPDITLDLMISDQRVDLVASGADIVLRTGALDDSSLVARRISMGRRIICAAPAYLARRGVPKRPADLAAHDCIVLHGFRRLTAWPFRRGRAVQVMQVKGALSTDSAEALREMALAGLGIIRATDYLLRDAIADGRLVPLLEVPHVSEDVPQWAVMAPARHRLPRIQAFVDFLVEMERAA